MTGNWVDNKRNGEGTQIYKNGDKYVGDWLQGIRSGKGSQKYINGDKYVGDWEKGERNGFGIYTDSKGNIFEGNWKNNLKNGMEFLFTIIRIALKESGKATPKMEKVKCFMQMVISMKEDG